MAVPEFREDWNPIVNRDLDQYREVPDGLPEQVIGDNTTCNLVISQIREMSPTRQRSGFPVGITRRGRHRGAAPMLDPR
jgi:hypothetical protein